MSTSSGFVDNLKSEAVRVGYRRSMQRSMYSVASKYLQLRRIEIIELNRDSLVPLETSRHGGIVSRLATEAELLAMRDEGRWAMSNQLIEGSLHGDRCLLSFVENKLAGYTWVHASTSPKILPGLRISIPNDYLYNYAGFTLPEFRGFGLQPYRHSAILNRPEWKSKVGLIGYVECTNWSSKKGQAKSGYHKLGQLTLLGRGTRFVSHFSPELRERGIRRVHA